MDIQLQSYKVSEENHLIIRSPTGVLFAQSVLPFSLPHKRRHPVTELNLPYAYLHVSLLENLLIANQMMIIVFID